jgi:hypothetical protein
MVPSEKEFVEIAEIPERTEKVKGKSVTPTLNQVEEKLKVTRKFLPPLLRPNSIAFDSSGRASENESENLAACFGTLSNSISPLKSDENISNINNSGSSESMNMGSCKAFYYSQLSIMLFEREVEGNPAFPEDLDRVHRWFTKELSDAQKLVCLHELLSLISPSQHRFLFTSVAFDTHQNGEEEASLLDLAGSEAQKRQSTRSSNETINKLEDRLKSLDLRLGESLFAGLKVAKSKFSTEKIEIFESPKHNRDTVSLSTSASFTSSQSQLPSCLTPISSSDTSKFSAILKMPKEDELFLKPGNAPPGFLSPAAPEFRPSEPSCYAEIYETDLSKWLRLLRLHKYDACLVPVHEKDKIELLKFDDKRLEAEGVATLGARKKLLRLFKRVRNELSV